MIILNTCTPPKREVAFTICRYELGWSDIINIILPTPTVMEFTHPYPSKGGDFRNYIPRDGIKN